MAAIGSTYKVISLDNIFFNEIAMLDVNIFNFSTAAGSEIGSRNVLYEIRENVAAWYYAIRNLCIALSLVVLAYIAVRMAISSIAEDKAKYKKMLMDWVVSFALIFLLNYFMVFIIQTNEGIIDIMKNARTAQSLQLSERFGGIFTTEETVESMQTKIVKLAFDVSFSRGFTATAIYLMMVAMTLMFLIVYIKRFITISILTIIAPLITVTYAIDKVGDGKAQALSKWMKEYVFNILIQPFHCIIYMLFIQNIYMTIIDISGVLQFGKIVVAFAMFGFMYKAEDVVREIFGFETHSLSSAAALGAAAVAKVQKGAKAAGNISKANAAVKGIKSPGNLPSKAGTGAGGKGPGGKKTPEKKGKTTGGGTGEGNGGKKSFKDKAKSFGKGYLKMNTGKTARKLAGMMLSSTIAYGMTGDAGKAYAAHSAIESGKASIQKANLKKNINKRKQDTRDAYQDYAEHKGLNTREERLAEAERLSQVDLNDPTLSADERNMAEWLQAEKQMHTALGSKDAQKDLMQNLTDYEDGL